MIKSIDPLSLVEVREIISESSREDKDEKEENNSKKIASFAKKVTKLKGNDAEKLKKEINDLGILKMKPAYLVKLIDILPRDAEDVRKIFIDVSLDQNEINQILESVKKYI
jgi:DNA-directed RNA polymerase subunit F